MVERKYIILSDDLFLLGNVLKIKIYYNAIPAIPAQCCGLRGIWGVGLM